MITFFRSQTTLLLLIALALHACKPEKNAATNQSNNHSELQKDSLQTQSLNKENKEPKAEIDPSQTLSDTSVHEKSVEIHAVKDESIKKDNAVNVPKKKKKKPVAKIEFKELEWDFGEITEGDIVSKKFSFTNTGKGPLQILATSATCGCTTPSFPFLDIEPGDSGVIGVTYNSVGKDGIQTPEVTVESNTYPRTTTLKLKGTVVPKKEVKSDPAIAKDSTANN